jgi:hypothetical protein
MNEWVLRGKLTVMGLELLVEKDVSTWGWLIRTPFGYDVDEDNDDIPTREQCIIVSVKKRMISCNG